MAHAPASRFSRPSPEASRLIQRSGTTVQVLTLAAGAHLAVHGGFHVLTFDNDDPPLGYIETLAGELFLESPDEIRRLTGVFEHLLSLALSPRESIRLVQEKKNGLG